jgi:hypothetical protein
MRTTALALLVMIAAVPSGAQQADDMNRVIDQGLNHSQVMQTAEHLMDAIGGRMTNSPQMRQAEAWTQAQFQSWGLKNVHKDGFAFGRGWSIVSSSVRMTAPRVIQLTAIPVAWTPGTGGTLSAQIVVAPMKKERDFEAWRGKLAGKIVLITLPDDGSEPTEPPFKRLSEDEVAKLDRYRQPDFDPSSIDRSLQRATFAGKLDTFLKAERAVAWARMAHRDGKLVHYKAYGYLNKQTAPEQLVERDCRIIRRMSEHSSTDGRKIRISSRAFLRSRKCRKKTQ